MADSLAGVKAQINSYGVLTALKDANGNNFFGKESAPLFDGYALAYYGVNAQTGSASYASYTQTMRWLPKSP